MTPAHQRIPGFVALLAVSAFVVGCGGGGGGASDGSQQPTPPAQPAPPTPQPPVPPPPPPPQLSLLVGNAGGAGNLDGSVDVARFELPRSVAVDADGNRYVSDTDNHVIRKISADGETVTTFAGRMREAGDTDAFGTDARFRNPEGLAIDSLFLYVADTGNGMVRRIRLQNADVRTLAGNPDGAIAVDGTPTRLGTARFDSPVALALGPASLGAPVFVADRGAGAIRMIAAGAVSTIAGTLNGQPNCGNSPVPTVPTAGNTALCAPSGLAFRIADGRVYFTEPGRSLVRAVAPSAAGFVAAAQNTVEFVAGSPTGVEGTDDGVGAAATFDFPQGIAATGNGELIIGQFAAVRRIRISSEGARVDIIAGSLNREFGNIDGSRATARFGRGLPGVAIDASAGLAVIADLNNHLIRTFDFASQQVGTLAGQREVEGNDDGAKDQATFRRPSGISIAADGSATLVDENSELTRRIDIAAGQVTTLAAITGVETRPVAVIAAETGQLAAIAGAVDHSVRVIENGEARLLAGAGFTDGEGFADGNGTLARFNSPSAILRGRQGLLWIADERNHRIRTVTPDGTAATFAGDSERGHVDGALELARFDGPVGLAFASSGELFVLEAGNKAIRRIGKDAQGRDIVSTVAQGLVDPVGLAIDDADNLYVIDATEQTVRRFRPGAGQGEIIVGTPNQCGFVPGAVPGVICRPRGITVRDGRLLLTMDQGVVMVEPLAP